MIIFWTLCIAGVSVALLYALWPLIKVDQSGDVDELQARISAYRANLYELEQDFANGNMAQADLAAAREEIELAIYQRAEQIKKKQVVDQQANLLPLLLVCTLVPIAAIVTYLKLGQHQLVHGARPATPASANAPAPAAVEEMVLGLAEKLKQRPDDVTGWTMLARSYMALGRYAQAVLAYEHLYSISADNPTVLVAYAEALSMTNAGRLSGKPQDLLETALQLEPLNKAGLWLSGMAAWQAGEDAAAIRFWRDLIPQIQDEQAVQQIEKLIARSQARLQEAPEADTDKRELSVKVILSEQLRSQVAPSSTVFVVARALAGPAMPLAVVRRQVSDLPFAVTLDDSAAMAPIAKLSDHKTVKVSARISLSGNAVRQAGDVSSEWVSVDTAQADTVILKLDQVLNQAVSRPAAVGQRP